MNFIRAGSGSIFFQTDGSVLSAPRFTTFSLRVQEVRLRVVGRGRLHGRGSQEAGNLYLLLSPQSEAVSILHFVCGYVRPQVANPWSSDDTLQRTFLKCSLQSYDFGTYVLISSFKSGYMFLCLYHWRVVSLSLFYGQFVLVPTRSKGDLNNGYVFYT